MRAVSLFLAISTFSTYLDGDVGDDDGEDVNVTVAVI